MSKSLGSMCFLVLAPALAMGAQPETPDPHKALYAGLIAYLGEQESALARPGPRGFSRRFGEHDSLPFMPARLMPAPVWTPVPGGSKLADRTIGYVDLDFLAPPHLRAKAEVTVELTLSAPSPCQVALLAMTPGQRDPRSPVWGCRLAKTVGLLGQHKAATHTLQLASQNEGPQGYSVALAPKGSAIVLIRCRVTTTAPNRDTARRMLKFDFGVPKSAVHPGFTRVLANTRYTPKRGYGWGRLDRARFTASHWAPAAGTGPGSALQGRDRGMTNDLFRDFVSAMGVYCNVLNHRLSVALPRGFYKVIVVNGDAQFDSARGPTDFVAEGKMMVENVCVPRGDMKAVAFFVEVNDGRLDLDLLTPCFWSVTAMVIIEQ